MDDVADMADRADVADGTDGLPPEGKPARDWTRAELLAFMRANAPEGVDAEALLPVVQRMVADGGDPRELVRTMRGVMAAGVYTVSANLWVDAADAGLPMSPHLTNAGFPPKDPVSGNAVFEVDEAGKGRSRCPSSCSRKSWCSNRSREQASWMCSAKGTASSP